MDPVKLVELGLPGDALQEEGDEGDPVFLGKRRRAADAEPVTTAMRTHRAMGLLNRPMMGAAMVFPAMLRVETRPDQRPTYGTAAGPLTVLHEASFELEAGASIAIVGPSGSGKTTLLGLCAGLDRATGGSIELAGERLDALDEDARARVRNESVGFVFQNFQLIPTLTALENVLVPLELRGERGCEPQGRALLERVGLAARADHYPVQLSGGEQQRVALARAFINTPKILFCDEPTGNLDGDTAGIHGRAHLRAQPRARDDACPGDPQLRAGRPLPAHPAPEGGPWRPTSGRRRAA
jgi:putative ABC transport system ATP-binding protein